MLIYALADVAEGIALDKYADINKLIEKAKANIAAL